MLSIRSQDYVVTVLVSIFISKTHKHFGSATCALRMTHNMYICIRIYASSTVSQHSGARTKNSPESL